MFKHARQHVFLKKYLPLPSVFKGLSYFGDRAIIKHPGFPMLQYMYAEDRIVGMQHKNHSDQQCSTHTALQTRCGVQNLIIYAGRLESGGCRINHWGSKSHGTRCSSYYPISGPRGSSVGQIPQTEFGSWAVP